MSRRFFVFRVGPLAALLTILLAAPALAHKPSDSYLTLDANGPALVARWDIAVKDLEFVVGLDANGDGDVTWGELKSRRSEVESHALSQLQLAADGAEALWRVNELQVVSHSDGLYAVLMLESDLPGDAASYALAYSLLFGVDPTHRGLVVFRRGGKSITHILSPDHPRVELDLSEAGLWRTFFQFTVEGVWHIWIGLDHILFLLALLLPAVWVRREKRWEPVEAFGPAASAVLKIVTVFTLAHSITLWLAVMDIFTLPGRLIEATIAFSIVVTALNNLLPVLNLKTWALAFGFGLIHGFGFANVLIDLGLSSGALAVSLLAFNVGVELGQLAIVLVFLPIAFVLRGTSFYRWVVFAAGSVDIALLALAWMIERGFWLEIIGF